MSKQLNALEKEFLIKRFKERTDVKISDFCEANGISVSAFKKWLSIYNQEGLKPYYYTFDNRYEIDFLIQYQNEIIPIEVKAGKSVNNTSLKVYNQMNEPKIRIRFSMKNLNKDDNLINIPLFMVEYLEKIVLIDNEL